MPEPKLSARQEAILEFIGRFVEENGYPPTIREIGKACNISSTSVVNYNLNKLEREGLLTRDREVSRGLRLAEAVREAVVSEFRVPLIGVIGASAPAPVFADASPDEFIEVTNDIIQPSDDIYALKVSGNSMIGDLIMDGDIVFMRQKNEVRDGDTVAVWLSDREEMTLKNFYREANGSVRLQPANPTMDPIIIDDPATVNVQGHVVAVYRQM